MMDVMSYGAKNDGVSDDTAAFQAALNAAGANGDMVFAPPGKGYFFAGHLTVPVGVVLQGSWESMPTAVGQLGTTFLITEGANNPTGTAFLHPSDTSAVRGVSLQYPNQPPGSGPPVPYPFAIHIGGDNSMAGILIENVELQNAYQGLSIAGGRHAIRNISGQPLLMGIQIDNSEDIILIENVRFNEYWSAAMNVWTKANGTAFWTGRADNFGMTNCFAESYLIGWKFVLGVDIGSYGTLLGCSTDSCATGLLLDGINENSPGISAIGGSWWGSDTAILLGENLRGTARVSCAEVGRIDMRGGNLAIGTCSFPEDSPNVFLHTGVMQFVESGNLGIVIQDLRNPPR